MKDSRRSLKLTPTKYKGKPSQILESIEYQGYEIKVLKHGNTGHTLYRAPRLEDLEPCWFMDLETAKKGVHKLLQTETVQELSTLESMLESSK
jgi:hypothetical protein